MDINLFREAVTVLSFLAFLAIIAWAVHPGNREEFERAAAMPLEDDPLPNPPPGGRERTWDAVSRD